MIIQKVSILRSAEQAGALSKFVRNEAGNLDPSLHWPKQRYTELLRSFKNTVRIATAEGLHAYLLRERRLGAVLGIATVIRPVRLHSEDGIVVNAHDLDYVLGEEASQANHITAATRVVETSGDLAFRYGRAPVALSPNTWSVTKEDAAHNFVASIDQANPDTNRGFTYLPSMHLTDMYYANLGDDAYGLVKGGADLQLWYGHEIITS